VTLDEFLSRVEAEQWTISVYGGDPGTVADQFATRNVVVEAESLPDGGTGGFAIIRDDSAFAAAVDLPTLQEVTAPPVPRLGEGADEPPTEGFRALLSVLDDTLFSSLDRRQLLATAREIEDRAYRTGRGTLRVGFQNFDRMVAQVPVYERLAAGTDLDIHVYARADGSPTIPGVTCHEVASGSDRAGEIGRFWVMTFDGGGEHNECALLAEERTPDTYYGFWTYDPALVDELGSYLAETYD
jgi:hypothetical protein